jgi:5-hydroxyisourate hydrolase|tara:strand:+ start:6703 stop:7053 length:351 start_codon:yes stop_codon:yes gene_type:complete
MTKLTTHVLDVYSGKPGKGIKVDLFYINGQERSKLKSIVLNSDGRSDDPLIENDQFKIGKYELVFYIGDYFKNILKNEKLPFLDDVVVRFGISKNSEHYHVPLLVSPWSYSTYKGS